MINKKRLINTFKKLVLIDSPAGFEAKIGDFIFSYLKDNVNFIKKDGYGNLYCQVNGRKTSLFFSAHMDTVEPGRGINPRVRNGYIVSDGTTILGADNKTAIVCILEVLKLLKEQKIDHRPLEIVFTKSEEVGNYGAINFDYSLLRAKVGYCFDLSSPVGTIVSASPYYERFDLTIIGKEAHASKPEEGINVLPILTKLLLAIKLGKLDEDSLLNIGVIKGGSVRNTVPGEIILKGELRSFREKKLLKHKNYLIRKLERVIKKYSSQYHIDFVRENPGYQHQSMASFHCFKTLKSKISSIGLNPKIIKSWGVSDANIFNNKGLLCFNLGDGGEFPHTKKERVKVSEMENLVRLMLKLLEVN